MKLYTEFAKFAPLWAPEDEGAGGGDGDEGTLDTVLTGEADDPTTANEGEPKKEGEEGTEGEPKKEGEGEPKKEGEGEPKKEGEGEQDGPPEAYDFTAIMPEGVEVDATMVESMAPAFKELGLTQEQANGLVKAYMAGAEQRAKADAEVIGNTMKTWVETAKADKEIGGAQWEETVRSANAVLKKFGTPELIQDVMIGQGVGNHPEVIRFVARIAKRVSDDVLDTGEKIDTSGTATESAWYGDTTPSKKKG